MFAHGLCLFSIKISMHSALLSSTLPLTEPWQHGTGVVWVRWYREYSGQRKDEFDSSHVALGRNWGDGAFRALSVIIRRAKSLEPALLDEALGVCRPSGLAVFVDTLKSWNHRRGAENTAILKSLLHSRGL